MTSFCQLASREPGNVKRKRVSLDLAKKEKNPRESHAIQCYNLSSKILQSVNFEGVTAVVNTEERVARRVSWRNEVKGTRLRQQRVVSILVGLTLPLENLEMLTAYTVDCFTSERFRVTLCFRVKGHPSRSQACPSIG